MGNGNLQAHYRMNIAIVSPGLAHDGDILRTKSLGGSETAAIQLAEVLAKDHSVRVLSPCETIKTINNVTYMPIEHAAKYIATADIDLLIASRDPKILAMPHNAKVCFFWCHDLALKRFADAVRGVVYQVDRICVLSEFQKNQYKEVYGLPDEAFKVIRNGIDLSLIKPHIGKPREKGVLVYGARPERGLENLVKPNGIMEEFLRQNIPVRLKVMFYDNVTQEMAPYYKALFDRCMQLPNVELVGSKTKAELYDIYARAWAYIYPTEFKEISCISAMEAQALGLPFITTPVAALNETLDKRAAIFVKAKASSLEAVSDFVWAVKNLLDDDARWERMSKAGMSRGATLSWDAVADSLVKEAHEIMLSNSSDPVRLYKHFFRLSDIEACREIEKRNEADQLFLARTERERQSVASGWNFALESASYLEHYNNEYRKASIDVYGNSENEPRWITLKRFLSGKANNIKTILDFGCDIGHQSVRMGNLLPNAKIYAVDISPKVISIAKQCRDKYGKHGNVALSVCKELPLEFADLFEDWSDDLEEVKSAGGFDVIVLGEVLEHVRDPYVLVECLEKFLSKDGYMFVTVPYGPWEYDSYEKEKNRYHLRHFELNDLNDIFGKKRNVDIFYGPVGQSERTGKSLGHHYVVYQKDDMPVGRINMDRKLAYQSPRQTLSVCMIAYNAESLLHRCLKSVSCVADEIIIALDPKTNDTTPQIAQKYGAKIIPGVDPMTVGFDQARNVSIAPAQSDWVLWIDSDEELLNPQNINKYLRNNCISAYGVAQHHLSVDPPMNLRPDLPMRLFRNGLGVKFFGVVHEHPETALNAGIGFGIVLSDSWIAHDGYLTEPIRRKRFLRNIDLVVRDRQKYPTRNLGKFLWLRDLIHLSRYRMESRNGMGPDPQVLAWANEAKDLFEKEFLPNYYDPMAPEALSYYSEACRILNIGVPVSVKIKLPIGERDIVGQFSSSDVAKTFIGNVVKLLTSQMEGEYL